jgi:hypothetical protein
MKRYEQPNQMAPLMRVGSGRLKPRTFSVADIEIIALRAFVDFTRTLAMRDRA